MCFAGDSLVPLSWNLILDLTANVLTRLGANLFLQRSEPIPQFRDNPVEVRQVLGESSKSNRPELSCFTQSRFVVEQIRLELDLRDPTLLFQQLQEDRESHSCVSGLRGTAWHNARRQQDGVASRSHHERRRFPASGHCPRYSDPSGVNCNLLRYVGRERIRVNVELKAQTHVPRCPLVLLLVSSGAP